MLPHLIDGIPVDTYGPTGLLAVVLLLIFTGRLVPWIFYNERGRIIEKLEAQLGVKDAQIAEKDKQLALVGELGETVNAVMRAVQTGPARKADSESP